MQEIEIDISQFQTKTAVIYQSNTFDYVVSLCDISNEPCPDFPNAVQKLQWNIPDPSKATGTDEQKLKAYRGARDLILEKIRTELLMTI
jgi:arsenate reductase